MYSLLLTFLYSIVFHASHMNYYGQIRMRWTVLVLTFPKQALVFICLQYKSFENTVRKGEIAHDEQFLLFPQCFLPFWRAFCTLIQADLKIYTVMEGT